MIVSLRRSTFRLTVLLLGLGLAGVAAPAADPPGDAAAAGVTAEITYLTGSSVYVDAGRDEGLREGDKIEVVRNGAVVATLRVTYLSSHKASCSIESGSAAPEIGDSVRFVPPEDRSPRDESPVVAPLETARAERASKKRRFPSWLRSQGVRGRIGVRYLSIQERGDVGGQLTQPAMDLRLDGQAVAGSPFDFSVDVRARRSTYDLSGGEVDEHNVSRVYRLSSSWTDTERGLRVTLGRQFSPTAAAVSIFDGVLAELTRNRFTAGAFSGTEPDIVDMGYSSEIREHGGYVGIRSSREAQRRWSLITGLAGSYNGGEVNREFVFLQSQYRGPRLSTYWAQEIDYNRGWKTQFDNGTVEPTSTYLNIRYEASETMTFHTGYDSRQRVRLYQDRTTPETEFDDSTRIGARVGWSWRPSVHYRFGLDARGNSGGSSGDSETYTARLAATGYTSFRLGGSTRSTYYTNDRVEGWLHSASAGTNLGSRVHLELGAGVRNETLLLPVPVDETLEWMTVDLDITLGRRWYLLISAERDRGEIDNNDQIYSSVTYRF